MVKTYEASGKTVEEAIDNALALANAAIEDVDIEVLELGGRGVFGLGKKDARVRISLDIFAEELKLPLSSKEPVHLKETAVVKEVDEAPQVTEMIRQRPAPTQKESVGHKKSRAKEHPVSKIEPKIPQESKAAAAPLLGGENTDIIATRARAFLDPIFSGLKVKPQQDLQIKDGIIWLVFSGPGLGCLIGRRGETLNALQYLTNLAINRNRKEHTRLVLDVEGYRAGREETLIALAKKMAEKAVRSGRRVELEPMNPHERRIVHIALQNDKRVDTMSLGEEPYRRVVIARRRQDNGQKGDYGKDHPQKRRNGPNRPGEKNPPAKQSNFSQQLSRQFSEQMKNR